jgi:phenylalanyl-tRNA synthetase alpha chain
MVADLLAPAGLNDAQAQSSAESLTARGLLVREEEVSARVFITEAGIAQLDFGGVPELRIAGKLDQGPLAVREVQDLDGLDKRTVGSAFGGLKKAGLIKVDKGQVTFVSGEGWEVHATREAFLENLQSEPAGLAWEPPGDEERAELEPSALAHLEDLEARSKRKGGVFQIRETRVRRYTVTAEGSTTQSGLGEAKPQVAQLTSDMLKDGSWRDVEFRPFNIADPPQVPTGRRNPYRAYLDLVKYKLTSMGFEEMSGSMVQPEFWNMDALFLPQFHPAREIHDVYYVQDAASGGAAYADEIEGGALEPVALEHEGKGVTGSRGWSYDFDRERAKRLVLRSQGTVLSARWLQTARSPGKYFGMARCFRYDEVDATHAPDFFQVEGIVTSEQTSFRHLLGLLKVFALEMARSEELMFVPGYFPFTEPSVEIHMKHPDIGWMELGGAGIFRPEVTKPHGIDTPVIAWGLGLDRMAMVALGIKDIRHLFTNNLPLGLRDLRKLVVR